MSQKSTYTNRETWLAHLRQKATDVKNEAAESLLDAAVFIRQEGKQKSDLAGAEPIAAALERIAFFLNGRTVEQIGEVASGAQPGEGETVVAAPLPALIGVFIIGLGAGWLLARSRSEVR